jgi:hypothetical protein
MNNLITRLPNYQKPAGKIVIADNINATKSEDVGEFLLSAEINYSMTLASQLSFTVIDKDLRMLKNNAFQIGRTVFYETRTLTDIYTNNPTVPVPITQIFEISSVNLSNGPGSSPQVQVNCYPKAIQQMKRDRKPKSISGSGSEYVKRAAQKYGLKFYGEYTSKSHKFAASQSGKLSESVWDVITSIASEAKFVVFEADGYLFFASQRFLLKKWGIEFTTSIKKDSNKKLIEVKDWYIPLRYNQQPQTSLGRLSDKFQLMQYPTLSLSDNSPFDGEGSAVINRVNATQIRPGMTVLLQDFGQFNGHYLITDVSFQELSPESVSIQFRKPEKEKETDIKQLPVGATGKNTIPAILSDVTQKNKNSAPSRGIQKTGRRP